MQIVIEIAEEEYKMLANPHQFLFHERTLDNLRESVKNGTPLPKGHGDLKDADAIMSIIKENLQIRPEFVIEHAPTIIAADRSEE